MSFPGPHRPPLVELQLAVPRLVMDASYGRRDGLASKTPQAIDGRSPMYDNESTKPIGMASHPKWESETIGRSLLTVRAGCLAGNLALLA
jgi:hypothetical protein